MEFRNLTPFESLAFSAYDVHQREHHVVVTRVVYRLVADPHGARTHRCEALTGDDRNALVTSDVYEGDAHTSSVRAESDLAPFKPRCDVVVRATAHAPQGEASARWSVSLRVETPTDPQPSDPDDAPRGVLVDKTLTVCGPRWFVRDGDRWTLTDPQPATRVPMRWEAAFGGRSRVVDARVEGGRELLHEVCFTNPLGAGWIERRHFEALDAAGIEQPAHLAAPQVERPDAPVRDLCVAEHPKHAVDARAMAALAGDYGATPAGFGWVGRAWTPRLQHAGTYDDAWVAARHPFLPDDFSFAYWNGAPTDQQIPWPGRGLAVTLTHLADATVAPGGVLSFELPPHRAFVMAWLQGLPVPVPAVLDTVDVDAEELTVTCLWRVMVPRALAPAALEARFEVDPHAPLLRIKEA